MKVYSETSLKNFEFWAGAKDRVKYLTFSDFDTIEAIFEELYPEGMSETEINDFIWFEEDTIAEWLGFSDFDELMQVREEEL